MKRVIITIFLLCSFSNVYAEEKDELKNLKSKMAVLNKEMQTFNLHSLDFPYAYMITVEKENTHDKSKPISLYNYSGKGLMEYMASSVEGGSVKKFSYVTKCDYNTEGQAPICYGDQVSIGANYSINTTPIGDNNYEINFKLDLNDVADMNKNNISDLVIQQVEINKIVINNMVTYKLNKETYVFNASNSNKLSKDNYNYIITLTLEPIKK